MSRLEQTFRRLKAAKRRALVIYLTAGDPDVAGCVAAACAAVEAGADILEIGIPFSDPVADGPVIQQAMLRSLAGGGGFQQTLEVIRQVRAAVQVPIVAFGYLNPLLWDGFATSCAELKEAGADGVLVVDLPAEEAEPMRLAASGAGLDWVPLLAPTTGEARARQIVKGATGFIYMVSMTGVTGGALHDVTRLIPLIDAARQESGLPVCLGFGVRDRVTAARAAHVADGVVVGSAVVSVLQTGEGAATQRIKDLVGELRAGVDGR